MTTPTTEGDCYVPYFDRQGNQVADAVAWAKLAGSVDCHVARTTVGRFYVSTMWIGVDIGWCEDGAPLIFETMTFARRKRDKNKLWASYGVLRRYATEEEARKGHERIVNQIRSRGAGSLWSHRQFKAWRATWLPR